MTLSSTLGPLRSTEPKDPNRKPLTSSYAALMKAVTQAGLMRKRPAFYITLFVGLSLALGGLITGFVLIGDSWFQLLIAAGLIAEWLCVLPPDLDKNEKEVAGEPAA